MTPEPAVTSGSAGSGVFAFGAGLATIGGAAPRIRCGFTTRRGGASAGGVSAGGVSGPPYDALNLGGAVGDNADAVATNRATLAASVGLPGEQVVWMRQVHGTTVTVVDGHGGPLGSAGPAGALADCDGIVTAAAGIGLAVLVADCVPILAGDPVAGVIAAVHAGRRGAAGGIAVRAIERMAGLGASIQDVSVLLGPAICGECYEVPAEMRDEVESSLPGAACITDRGTPGLDLRAGLARQLRAVGVAQVLLDPRCTYSDLDQFSHRRDAPTGRSAGLIWMPN